MKKGKRFLSLAISMLMLLGLTAPAYAFTPTQTGDANINRIKEEASVAAKQSITEEDLNEALVIVRELECAFSEAHITRESYQKFFDVYYITALSLSDKVSVLHCTKIALEGNSAFDEAEVYATSKGYDTDCYRHFSWNYRSVNATTLEATRIFTINYEWYAITKDNIDAEYARQLEYYIKIDPMNADSLARAATIAYATNYRNNLIDRSRNSYSTFLGLFNKSAIQDFWNNRAGRNYSSTTGGREAAYIAAYNNGALTVGDNPTASQQSSTFYSPTMWIP